MKIGDMIKLPVKTGVVLKGSENDGMFMDDASGHLLCELFDYGSELPVAVLLAINTHDDHVDLIKRMREKLLDWAEPYCPNCGAYVDGGAKEKESHRPDCYLDALIKEAEGVE
jgi:hypothetical protein